MFKCLKCPKEFGSEEALRMHTEAKHPENVREPLLSSRTKKRIKLWSIVAAIFTVIIGVPAYLYSAAEILPPTSPAGHIEISPLSHVMRQPMQFEVQKHMLEHADGSGPPGIILNYNCVQYQCEEGLIESLEAFADKYPANVYVAPFPKMDAKIALTKHNRIKVLESFDENIIDRFIRFG